MGRLAAIRGRGVRWRARVRGREGERRVGEVGYRGGGEEGKRRAQQVGGVGEDAVSAAGRGESGREGNAAGSGGFSRDTRDLDSPLLSPAWPLVGGANLPTFRLVGLPTFRLFDLLACWEVGELVGCGWCGCGERERSRGGAVYPGVRRGKREQVGELQGVGRLGRATGGACGVV